MKKTFIVFSLTALLASCSSPKISLSDAMNLLKGNWALQSIAGQSGLGTLFADKLPALQFDTEGMKVSGNNGCNNIRGPLSLEAGNKISFGQLAGTKMACPGQGEGIFMDALNKVTNFKVDNGVMKLLAGEQEVMSFAKGSQ
ncbi:MAG: META domain-containing protein [Ferruginibacter sp.]|nr:META domain-containing protein [Cytophagales bacterium]